MMNVHFWMMRHGEHVDGDLTPHDLKRIAIAAERHLPERTLGYAFHSGTRHAKRTLEHALNARGYKVGRKRDLRRKSIQVRVEPAFGLAWLENPNLPQRSVAEAEGVIVKKYGNRFSAYHWLNEWGPAWGIRRGAETRLLDMARALALVAESHGHEPPHIFIVAENPVSELIAPNPMNIPSPDPADIICYEVDTDKENCVIASARYLPCPAPNQAESDVSRFAETPI